MPEQVKPSNRPRATARINPNLDKHLVAYMAAACAAGVSMLAAAQPAEAKIVYTATNQMVNGPTPIDLNHDGIADFSINPQRISHLFGLCVSPQVTGNAIRAGANFGAAAGFLGVPVANGEKFITNTFYSYGVLMAGNYGYGTFSTQFGPWVNVQNRYLGLKLIIDGSAHYGWARLSVTKFGQAVLTGYAYETIPGKPILEGHTFGPEEADSFAPAELQDPTPQPANLGVLALGAPALAVWRREEDVVAQ